MKMLTSTIIILFSVGHFAAAQAIEPNEHKEVKQEILRSKQVKEWRNALIAYQKNSILLCELKKRQPNFNIICGKPNQHWGEQHVLEMFRRMRLDKELKASVDLKAKELRAVHPDVFRLFKVEDIFPELYAPIKKAREELLFKNLGPATL